MPCSSGPDRWRCASSRVAGATTPAGTRRGSRSRRPAGSTSVSSPQSPPTRGAWRCGPTRFPTATSPCTRCSSPTWACWSARSSRSTSWPKTARGTASSSSSSWRRRCRSPAPSARRSTRSRSNERADLGFEEPPRGRPQFGLPAPVEGVAQPAAEAGHVGPVEDEPALGEPGLELAIEALRVLALPRHVDGHVALDDRLNVGRQPAPEPSIGQHVEARPHVVGDGHVARDLVERSEEHTSELQSLRHLVCRLLLEKKKKKK